MAERRAAAPSRPKPRLPWIYLATLLLGLAGVAVVALTADHPTLAWRKFVAVVSASLCYLSLVRLLRTGRTGRRRRR